ncbi:MAG: hypothetical protein PHC30_03750 [Lentisphaeria bacterium]|nr:hypothetical protein [Lentisphaeria bacterium]
MFLNQPLLIVFAAALLPLLPASATAAPAADFNVAAEWEALFGGVTSRLPGTPGNLEVEKRVAARFRDSGLEHGDMTFTAPTFVPGKATITLADGRRFPIRPLAPTLFRPGNFHQKSFPAPLQNGGRGTEQDLEQLQGKTLKGALILLDFDCGDQWQRLLRFGVAGFVFIDNGGDQHAQAAAKITGTETAVPRYLISAEAGLALRQGLTERDLTVRVDAEPSRWENRDLRNLWAIVPGANPDLAAEAVLITAPMDSNGVVPELGQGAQDAANLLMLMRLFDEYRSQPPDRTVIFCAVNAHTQNYLGERILAWNLLVPRLTVEKALDAINNDLRLEEMLLGHYRTLNLNPPTAEDEAFLISLRDLVDSSTGKNISVKEPVVDLARRDVNALKVRQLRLNRENLAQEVLQAKSAEIEKLRHRHVNVLTLFNKAGIRTKLSDLDEQELGILRGYIREIVSTRTAWSEKNRSEITRGGANNAIRNALASRTVKLAFCLELAWTNNSLGLAANDINGVVRWQHKFGMNAAALAAKLPVLTEGQPAIRFVDGMTRQGGLPEGHYFPRSSDTVSVFQAAGALPAFSVRNAFSDYGRLFTTRDTFDHLDQGRVQATIKVVADLTRAILADGLITSPSELPRAVAPSQTWFPAWGVQVKAFKFDDFSASVLPQLPVPGAALVLHDPRDLDTPLRSGNVMTGYLALTDERAVASFQAVTAASLQPNAYHFDRDFTTVLHVIDAGDAENKMSSTIPRGALTKTLALFQGVEYPIMTRDNPATISVTPITEHSFLVLNGRLNHAPKKFGLSGISSTFSKKLFNRMGGPAAVYMEENEPLKLLTSERVLALNTSADDPAGEGFKHPVQLGSDLFAVAAVDMSRLNHDRMEKLRGTSDELARIFLERGDESIARLQASRDQRDWLGYLRHLHLAIGAQLKAYKRMTDITNDMLKAVVFYLALMLPFCFFAEKLIFKFKKIEQEMLAFAGLFALTFLVFRNIHPAFRVAQAPEAIFIAFVMGGLGAFVIKILHGRFEGEMQLLFRTQEAFDSNSAGFSTVGQSAMLIGVNNMKRRRIRTALTTATVVLVTFTMLAFTSISKKLSPTIITRAQQAPYTGLMYHWPGNARMDEATLRTFREILTGRAELCVRRWLLPPKVADGELPFKIMTAAGRTANIDAFLGLPPHDDGFAERIPLSAGRFFTSDDAAEAIITENLAKALKLTAEDLGTALTFEGRPYQIVGILDDAQFLQLKDINQRPIIPIKALLQQASGEQDLAAMAAGDEEADTGIFYTDLSALVLLPSGACQQAGGQPYSLSAKLHDQAALWPVVDELLTITNASKFYISSTAPFQVGAAARRSTPPGVYYVGEGYRTSIGGLAFLLIPLLISSTIILNTMLGSVFERKAEIAIYNAVGLNPTHIGMFFLAEAFVYSVIGSVGGYLIGQMTSIFLTRTGLIADINLNFSSLSVVYVILFTVGVVLLSTIYPSMVATRAAVPSGKRKWSLPAHNGREMQVVFPFIYQPQLIYGINGYLAEYFGRYTEASFGDLIAHCSSCVRGQDGEGRDVLKVTYDVALAPFDLGVTQHLLFTIAYEERVQAYRLTMLNTRMSGQDSNWTATNKPFLEKLRTYLLHWRNLSPAEHADFNRKGEELFAAHR